MNTLHHSVYVIELDPAAQGDPGPGGYRRCLYVGLTGLSIEERFHQHKSGKKSSSKVKKYGRAVAWDLCSPKNPMTYEEAKCEEQLLKLELERRGFRVFGGH